MNKVILITPIIVILLVGVISTPNVYASESKAKRYSNVYNDGSQQACTDLQIGNAFNPACDPTGAHTSDGQKAS